MADNKQTTGGDEDTGPKIKMGKIGKKSKKTAGGAQQAAVAGTNETFTKKLKVS